MALLAEVAVINQAEKRVYGGRWRVAQQIGRGGQATVYRVEDLKGTLSDSDAVQLLKAAMKEAPRAAYHQSSDAGFPELVDAIRKVAASASLPAAALKELHPMDAAINPATALERMKREFAAMQTVKHPGLIQAIDADLADRWFVTPYFRNGSLDSRIERYKGDVLGALLAFRPLVEAVAALHVEGIVHRDIKPANIFVGDDDRHLVLGDCGLAIRVVGEERLTETYEKAGSSDWMPGWATVMRLEDVRPAFDVFCLGKVLWAMVSGMRGLRLWYHSDSDHPEFNLREIFPNQPDVTWVTRILGKTVVEKQAKCLATAGELLPMVDLAIHALERGCQLPGLVKQLRCRFCSYGVYERISDFQHSFADPHDEMRYFRCNHCAHVESFLIRHKQSQPGWDAE